MLLVRNTKHVNPISLHLYSKMFGTSEGKRMRKLICCWRLLMSRTNDIKNPPVCVKTKEYKRVYFAQFQIESLLFRFFFHQRETLHEVIHVRGCIHAVNLWMSDNIGITIALCCAIGLPQVI